MRGVSNEIVNLRCLASANGGYMVQLAVLGISIAYFVPLSAWIDAMTWISAVSERL